MSKIEKSLYGFITWVYLGGLLGFFLAVLIGGRGGMFFGFLYIFAIYTLVINILYPLQ